MADDYYTVSRLDTPSPDCLIVEIGRPLDESSGGNNESASMFDMHPWDTPYLREDSSEKSGQEEPRMGLDNISLELTSLFESLPEERMPEFREWKIVHHFESGNNQHLVPVFFITILLLSGTECDIEHFREAVSGKIFCNLFRNSFKSSLMRRKVWDKLEYTIIGGHRRK